MDLNEKALLYRAQTGDRRAAETLYERYYLDIYTYLYYRVSDQSTAEQLSTQVFVRMIRRLPQFHNHKISFISWLYDLAHELAAEKQPAYQPQLFSTEVLDPDQDPQSISANRCFELAIRHLNDQEKSIVVHRFVEGRSVKDLVQITNQSERALRSLQTRALKSLQVALEKETS
jgi:RNA polymerase sigma-70 factor (ECF subfamily)